MALLNTFVSVRSILANAQVEGSEIRGTLSLSAQNLAWLKELVTHEVADPVAAQGDRSVHIEDLKQSDAASTVTVTLLHRNLTRQGSDYFEKFSDLIERHPISPPTHEYYVQDVTFFSHANRPALVQNYFDTLQFIRLLRSIADYWDDRPPSGSLVLFHKQKIEVPIAYRQIDLQPISGLVEFGSDLDAAHDRDHRLSLLKIIIVEAVANVSGDRFQFLLKNWPMLKEKFGHSYRMYLSNFSWEKVRAEVDKEKIEFVKKLNSTVTDIQTKLIALPAAFLLIAAQLKHVGKFDISNLVVLIAALVFTALLCFMIGNQIHALKAIDFDVGRLRQRLKTEGHLVADISERFFELERLHLRQSRILWFCLAVSILVGIISAVLFALYTFVEPKVPVPVKPKP
jgi:hypothetical protein